MTKFNTNVTKFVHNANSSIRSLIKGMNIEFIRENN